jgi:tetratricopeptide repeat protein
MTGRQTLRGTLGAMVGRPQAPRSRRLGFAAGLAFVIALFTFQVGPAFGRSELFAEGRALFYSNRLQDALPLLEQAAASRRQDAEILALLADTYRRLGRREDAQRTVLKALAIDPCHSYALSVMGNNFNPQYGDWEGADPDSVWPYLTAAVTCDSTEGDAWQGLMIEALRRNEFAVERTSLRQLVGTGFLTPSVLAYSRWLLRDLPDSTVLIVNGDMDTYPPRALQEVEGLRPDVVIVNLPLLELDWYRRMVRDRYRVPMPFQEQALDDLAPIRGPQGTWVLAAKRVVRGWFAMIDAGTLRRPLAIATTVSDRDFAHDALAREVLAGPYWLVTADASQSPVDTMRVRASLSSLRAKDFTGPWLSARNRSPILQVSTPSLVNNMVYCAAYYYVACQRAGRASEALAIQAWASEFARAAEIDPVLRLRIEQWGNEPSPAGGKP